MSFEQEQQFIVQQAVVLIAHAHYGEDLAVKTIGRLMRQAAELQRQELATRSNR